MPSQYTKEAMILFNSLVKRGYGVLTEYPILRDGEFNREGKPKSYQVDLLVDRFLILEVEGNGSASKNNKERDDYLRKKGYTLKHIPNEHITNPTELEKELSCISLLIDAHKRRFSIKDVANELYNYGMYNRDALKLLVSMLDNAVLAEIHRAERELGKSVGFNR